MTIDEFKKAIHKLGLSVDDSSGQILIDWDRIPFSEPDRPYWAMLSAIPGVSGSVLAILIAGFGSARAVFNQSSGELKSLGIKNGVIAEISKLRENSHHPGFIQKIFAQKSKTNAYPLLFIVPPEKSFPFLLKKISHGPSQLWVWGNLKVLSAKNPIAVVGTRKITPYGKEITETITRGLASRGCTIISGLMYGVDEAAMRAALSVGAPVIGVWAGGLLPRSFSGRFRLAHDVVAAGGVIVSEFCVDQLPNKGLFPVRDRIISGLAKAVVVTEGAITSGSLITAKCGIEQGRAVFAVPGPVTSSLSAGPNELLKLGAQLATSAQDILDYLGIKNHSDSANESEFFSYQPQNETEKLIINLLSETPLSADELVRATKLQPNKLAETLINLEMLNVVCQSDGEWRLKS